MFEKLNITLQVTNDAEARELRKGWEEIITGKKLARTDAFEHGIEAVMERARPALEIIETAIRQNPTMSQAGRLVRFHAGVYSGQGITAVALYYSRYFLPSVLTRKMRRPVSHLDKQNTRAAPRWL
jgi:hypothetical protein